MKRFIKHLFMLCLFGMISMGAKAEVVGGPCGDNATWSLDTETWKLTISGSGDMTNFEYSNVPWYDYRRSILSVEISGQITSIGNYAFCSFGKMTNIVIPNSVTSIGSSAFYGCKSLTSVTIPNYVASIGESAFYGCKSLTSVTIPNYVTSIGDYAFEECSGLTSVTIGNSVTEIGDYAFYNCSGLTSVTIPNYVTSIGDRAFNGCKSLTSVTIPNYVTSIGDRAFNGCKSLTSIAVESGNKVYDSRDNCNAIIETVSNTLITGCKTTIIPNSVTSIGSSAFEDCLGLTSIAIPNSVTSIRASAFFYCNNLNSVHITDLDKWAEIEFEYRNANPLYYAENLYLNGQLVTEAKLTTAQKIGDYAFTRCSSLTSVTIPNYVTSIGDYAFEDCSGLTSVTIGNSVTEIGDYAFHYCSGLKSVAIPNSVTSIGDFAFRSCSGLTSVTIPNSVTKIGEYAFAYCSGLRNIIANGINAPTVGSSCFYDVYGCSLHVPLGSEESYTSNFGTYFKSGNSYGNSIVPYSAYFKNSAGEYSFEVWDASSDVELSEGADKVYVPVEATVNDLQYKRTFNNTDWQALYVPFELDVKNDLAGFNVYEISTSSADAINVTLITEGKTSANTAYLIKAKATGEQTIPVSSKTVKVTVENTNSDLSDFEIVGTYEKLNYGDINGDWYALKGGKFMKAGEGAFLNPYRFYLKRKSSSSKESIDINLNEVTGIEAVQSADKRANNGKHYNLQGIEVNENYNGMIIINGKKYLKK